MGNLECFKPNFCLSLKHKYLLLQFIKFTYDFQRFVSLIVTRLHSFILIHNHGQVCRKRTGSARRSLECRGGARALPCGPRGHHTRDVRKTRKHGTCKLKIIETIIPKRQRARRIHRSYSYY